MKMGALHSFYHLYKLRRRLFWPANKLESLRRKKLASLLRYCYRHIPYYREQFKKIGAQPEDFHTPEDLVNFPILEKETLRDRTEDFLDPKADRSAWIHYSSSGSTGIPLQLWYLPAERQRMGFIMTREFLQHGLKPWHRMANLTEPRHFTSKNRWYHRLGLMDEKFLSIFEQADLNLATLRKIKPHIVIGFPTILLVLGRLMLQEDAPPMRPKLLFTLAEVLTSDYRKTLSEQWGVEPIDIYGANETGHIAIQCSRRENYHINADSVHVEIIVKDKPAEIGERGEVVITNFDLRIMPILRYRVGDITHRVKGKCPCGSPLPLLGPIAGRSDGFVMGANGKLYSALEVSLLLHPLRGIDHYRLIQEKAGYVCVEWVPGAPGSAPENEIRTLLKGHLGSEIEIETRKVSALPRERSGKIRSVISTLSHPFW